ncbi:titin-like [Micropterus salmoides]|uniref:titin-like n=1 Tax=Micropterus salmoides TaxID=27706 RepID=UPI0018EC083E|nr:titin-like [Micropterus salmoides]XP_038586552.1 titin-like [Micropterus salmoides]
MAGLTFAPFVTFLLCSWIFVLCQGTQELKVKPGENATLQCQSHRGADITVIKWIRTDLKSDDFVFYLTPDQTNGEYQNSLFQDRVELQDPEKKNGDASVILKNVNINDTGTYECWIKERNNPGQAKLIRTIELTVTGTQEVKVKAGEDATLQCQSHRGADIEVIKWIRTDLKSDDIYVFYLTPDQTNGEYQNSLFQDRVELQDPEKKNGDASVILKNVNINDTGTYECWIKERNNPGQAKLIRTIELTVTETQEVKVKPGENATLQCQSHRGADIVVIKWIRTDLKSDDFVFYLSPDQINGEYQNSLFQGRVELQDPEKKNGDASVILKNVNINDAETYECWIKERNNPGQAKLIRTIELTVTETQEVKVKPGEDATLQCQSHRGADIVVIKWIRPDLKPGDYVFYLSPDKINGEYQNSLFQGRVELQDPEKKNGNASVILKNVNINDAGTYECWIKERNSGRRKRDAEPISAIELTVTEPDGHKKGNVGLMVGLPVVAVLLVAVVGTMLFKKRRGETPHTGGETPHTGGETPHTGGETDALNSPTSG